VFLDSLESGAVVRFKYFLSCNLFMREQIIGSLRLIPATVDSGWNTFLRLRTQLFYHRLSPLIA
ncbi:MAG: hypothetical protein BECKG1743F_GA0114225_103933, partial [Candidatus Kentron sp. G]